MAKTPPPPPRAVRWGKIALAASGWIAALFLGLLDLPAKINSFADEAPEASRHVGEFLYLDRKLTGAWTSSQPEGEVIAKPLDPRLETLPGAPVHLAMRVYGGEAQGTISSAGLRDHYLFSLVELEGRAAGEGIAGSAWDVVDGKKVALAQFTLTPSTRAGEPVLLFKLNGDGSPYFPDEAVLWATEDGPEGEFGIPLKDTVREMTGEDLDDVQDRLK